MFSCRIALSSMDLPSAFLPCMLKKNVKTSKMLLSPYLMVVTMFRVMCSIHLSHGDLTIGQKVPKLTRATLLTTFYMACGKSTKRTVYNFPSTLPFFLPRFQKGYICGQPKVVNSLFRLSCRCLQLNPELP